MKISVSFSRRLASSYVALLFGAAPLIGVAADAPTSIRMGQTRAEVEQSINAKLVEDPTSIYRNAFAASDVTETLRKQLPQTLSKLDFKERRFYFDDLGKLWKMRLEAKLPANEAFALMVETANLLERDTRLKRVPQDNSPKKLDFKITVPRVCYDDNRQAFRVKQKAVKRLSSLWGGFSQPERYAVAMNLGCDFIYLTHRFVNPEHTWTTVNFESPGGLSAERLEEAEPKLTQVLLTYNLVQATATQSDLEEAEEPMKKAR